MDKPLDFTRVDRIVADNKASKGTGSEIDWQQGNKVRCLATTSFPQLATNEKNMNDVGWKIRMEFSYLHFPTCS